MTNAHSLLPSREEERNPFVYDICPRNITSGVPTDSPVNVETENAPYIVCKCSFIIPSTGVNTE